MAKNSPASGTSKKQSQAPLNILFLVLLVAYGFVTVVTPNLRTLDSNGPKFLGLALLNLVTFVILSRDKSFKASPEKYFGFFTNGIGLAYSGLMIVSLLSFFKVINLLEAVVHFSKIFTTFTAAFLVTVLLREDKRNLPYLCLSMTLLLIYDSLSVFGEIQKYINGKIATIGDIKSVYSNKNILASSIFVKIPFALWLMIFNKKWLKGIGITGTFMAILATFFMSTRAFYLGTFVLSVVLLSYFALRYFQSRDKNHLQLAGIYLGLLFSGLLIFTVVQKYSYPKTQDIYDQGIGERLSSFNDTSTSQRLNAWKRSWHVWKEDPVLGVGVGNWKLATLKEENQTSVDFIYQYKAHNDFIEITAETGIFGGLFFLSIFLLTGLVFLAVLFRKSDSEWLHLFFLPAFGLLFYSVDAFFNFPQDRPEIQAFFALYVAVSVSFISLFSKSGAAGRTEGSGQETLLVRILSPLENKIPTGKPVNIWLDRTFTGVFGLMIVASVYFLYLNFDSLKTQRIVLEELKSKKLKTSANKIINGFPSIPDITQYGEPIAVQKGRYLINEGRNQEAIKTIMGDKSSPYDARPEFFIAMAYNNMKNADSCLAYARKVYALKPNFYQNISLMCQVLQQKGLHSEGEGVLENYLHTTKSNSQAWVYASVFYDNAGKLQKAVEVLDSAAHYCPGDTMVIKQKVYIEAKWIKTKYEGIYSAATTAYNEQKYDLAIQYYTDLLQKSPNFAEALIKRAFCFYYVKNYLKSNQDLEHLFINGVRQGVLYNLQGVNYNFLGDPDKACKNFKVAADLGDKDGISNYAKLCQSKINIGGLLNKKSN